MDNKVSSSDSSLEEKKTETPKTPRTPKRILISYQGEWYDVTDFSHPGEGSGVYLEDYNGKEVDEEIQNAHMTDEPQCMLAQAKKKNEFYGIKYVGKVTQIDKEEK